MKSNWGVIRLAVSIASGVAYTQTYGAIIALNWTEGERKIMFIGARALLVGTCRGQSTSDIRASNRAVIGQQAKLPLWMSASAKGWPNEPKI
jgi:hypothetical protein